MFNRQTSVVKIFWVNENIKKLLNGGGILYVIYSIQIYPFPCLDTNESSIHKISPFINEKILMKY